MPKPSTPADLPPPILIDAPGKLDELIADLAGQREIAVDTEADSFFSYREKVCLVQVSVEDRDYLVDPLAGVDLAPLGEVLADPARTKIFHDGEYDVLILKREYGFDFAGLFDTRVAAAALGAQNPGLASVLREHFGVELDKSMQRSDWSARPLSDKQIAYARLDTRFLIPLMREQTKELQRCGRTMIVEGECARLAALTAQSNEFNPDDFVRIKGARSLGPRERQALRELFRLREDLARERDVPPFRVMNQDALLNLAKARPKNRQQLKDVNGFTWKQIRRIGDDVLAALERARELGPLTKLPSLPKRDGTGDFDEAEIELHERLKSWRKERARNEGLDSSLVLNRHVLLRLTEEKPDRRDTLERVDGLQPWQLEMFGDEIVGVVRTFKKDLARGAVPLTGRRGPRRR